MGEKYRAQIWKVSVRTSFSLSLLSVITEFENRVDKCYIRKHICENKCTFEKLSVGGISQSIGGSVHLGQPNGKTMPKVLSEEIA